MKWDIDSVSFVEGTRGGEEGTGEGEEGTMGRGRRREDIDSANYVDDIAI